MTTLKGNHHYPCMPANNPNIQYPLGNNDAEHERLAWQASRLDPFTESLFRAAGIGPEQRVLDLGSGAGDVAMLAARIVGPSGAVVGVERDARSIAHAEARVAAANLVNVRFTQSDVSQIPRGELFDAAVGRFILMFLPHPAAVLRSLLPLVRQGGVFAFHEVSWASFLRACAPLPACAACAGLIHDTFQGTGANTDMGLELDRVFEDAGLPAPTVKPDVLFGNNQDLIQWMVDLLRILRPQIEKLDLSMEKLGDIATLPARLNAELAASDAAVTGPALIGAWSLQPREEVLR